MKKNTVLKIDRRIVQQMVDIARFEGRCVWLLHFDSLVSVFSGDFAKRAKTIAHVDRFS